MITHSHYENIDLQMTSQGFAPSYDDVELEWIEEEVISLARDLAASMEDEVAPSR
jgi:hypothetical protein